MRTIRQNKMIRIGILVMIIGGLSIGFAAFSNSLNIKSSTTVSPSQDEFKIEASCSSNAANECEITPTANNEILISNSSKAIIENTNDGIIVKNINFYFTEPGQEITYSFYIRNVGNLTAYIKSYGFKNIDGLSKTVKCTAGEGTSQKLVDAFCNNGLSYNFSVLNSTTGYGIYHAFEDSTNQKIEINKSGLISLTVKYYDKQRRVDGPVEIEIGEFYINFSTVPNS